MGESLAGISARRDLGLRIRVCLDDDLIDLPWEFLYRPDVDAPAAQSGFLLTDGRISLTREPPSIVGAQASSDRPQRGLFVGAMFDDGSDGWSVRLEHRSLTNAMNRVHGLLSFDFTRADDTAAVDQALSAGCDVFHYAGHTEVGNGCGTLIQLVHAARLMAQLELVEHAASAVAAYTPPIDLKRERGSDRAASRLDCQRRACSPPRARGHVSRSSTRATAGSGPSCGRSCVQALQPSSECRA